MVDEAPGRLTTAGIGWHTGDTAVKTPARRRKVAPTSEDGRTCSRRHDPSNFLPDTGAVVPRWGGPWADGQLPPDSLVAPRFER